jgi:hypothetical protein
MHLRYVKTMSLGLLFAVGGLLYAAGQPPQVWSTTPDCTLDTLKGTYLFAPQGFQVQDGQQLPIAFAGTETYDGKGHVEGQLTQSINGEISRVTYRGTYTITPDCVSTETITDSTGATSHYDQFVSPDGKEFTFIQTEPGSSIAGSERRVSKLW